MNKIVDAAKWVFSSSEAANFRRLWVRAMLSPGWDLVLVALFLVAILAAAPAHAGPGAGIIVTTAPVVRQATDSGSCYTIASADQRAYCLAKAHRESGRCYSIQDAGLRSQCLAEVRR